MTKAEAVKQFKAGNPSTLAFKTLGYPFEAFLRWAQVSEETREKVVALVVRDFGGGQ